MTSNRKLLAYKIKIIRQLDKGKTGKQLAEEFWNLNINNRLLYVYICNYVLYTNKLQIS